MNRRQVIEVPGLHHKNPIPMATRIGPFLATGGIPPTDPETGLAPSDVETQCALMFANIRRIMKAAGGSVDDILKLSVWVREDGYKTHINQEWLDMFPDPASRPARHTFVYKDLILDYLVQCEILAVLPPGE